MTRRDGGNQVRVSMGIRVVIVHAFCCNLCHPKSVDSISSCISVIIVASVFSTSELGIPAVTSWLIT